MTETPLRTIQKEKKFTVKKLLILLLLLALINISIFITINYLPSLQQTEMNTSDDTHIYYMGKKIEHNALISDGKLYLPFKFIQENIDSTIQWNEEKQLAIITTDKEVYHIPLGKSEGLLNLKPFSFTYPIIEHDNEIYLPVDPISSFYEIELKHHEDKSIVTVHNLNEPIQQGQVNKTTKIRKNPSLTSPWLEEIELGKEVNILREDKGWYWIEDSDGRIGYVDKNRIDLTDIKQTEVVKEKQQPWNPLGEEIILTWEYATYKTADPKDINKLSGVHVVSPTWFHLQEDGLVSNKADLEYVQWAHKNNYQVWGLFSNSFDLELTHQMLADPELRIKVIKQLLSYAELYDLDGINVDFENVYLKDKELLVQFMRELTPLMHEKDKVVSIDVTFKSTSETWSLFYDRKKLGEIADYVIVMAYDEHWSGSPTAGSVASLPWVENGLKGILEDVPSEKVILGVPFYTRLWTETIAEDGTKEVTSQALSMDKAQEWIAEKNAKVQYDSKSGQNYVELIEGNITYKMWLEDGQSMEKRIDLMKKYDLAGIAGWRRGFESENFWNEIVHYMKR